MNNPRSMKVATGLTSVEFNNLSNLFCDAWYSHESSRKFTLAGNERSRKFGGGRRSELKTTDDKLFFILFWFKVYPTLDETTNIKTPCLVAYFLSSPLY